MIFFQLFNWFQVFFCEIEIPKISGQSEQVKNDLFFKKKGGEDVHVDGFSYIFSYFIFYPEYLKS
jgi:hypothetical protein